MVIISDTTTLNNLLVVGKIYLLRNLYQEITIPPAVRDELLAFAEMRPVVAQFLAENWVHVDAPTDTLSLRVLRLSLDGVAAKLKPLPWPSSVRLTCSSWMNKQPEKRRGNEDCASSVFWEFCWKLSGMD